jgi:hypothetical protein
MKTYPIAVRKTALTGIPVYWHPDTGFLAFGTVRKKFCV